MAYYDIHNLKRIKGKGKPLLINNLNYLKDDSFLPVLKNNSSCSADTQKIGWISKDSTTLDAQKAIRMCLDSVPMNSYQKDYWAIYDKESDNNRYKSVYYNRENLPGQIQYYVDPEMTNPFFPPLFNENTQSTGSVYIDPMGSTHYDFRRNIVQPLDCSDCGITEIRELQFHREDMLSNIMRSRNKREYEPVYFNFTTRYQN
jgi:hypothetical protein